MTSMDKSGAVLAWKGMPASTPPTPLLNRFTAHVIRARTPEEVLDGLDDFAAKLLPVNVLGVGRMPQRTSDWRSIELGRDVFLHASAPVEWWNEYAAKAAHGYDPGIMMAKSSLVAYTWTETMRMLEPIGFDRWPYELARKYGIRDALTCCVGQRWLVAYWSRQVLVNVLTHPLRLLLIAAAGFAALRLEQVLGEDRGGSEIGRRSPRASSPPCGWSRWAREPRRSPSCSASARRPCAATSRRCRPSSACAIARTPRQKPSDSS
jgi:hypothetical protein